VSRAGLQLPSSDRTTSACDIQCSYACYFSRAKLGRKEKGGKTEKEVQ
jgi:hypothetical protein